MITSSEHTNGQWQYEIEQHSFFGGPVTKKKMKRPRQIPEGLSHNDERVLKRVMRRAYHLDMLFNVFGYKVGWSGIVGVVPVIGDLTGIVFSLLLFKTAREVDGGLPWDVQGYFLLNIIVDFLLGLVPIVGDFVEVMYKANSRNALVLEKHLKEKGRINIERKRLGISYETDGSDVSGYPTQMKDLSDESIQLSPLKHHSIDRDPATGSSLDGSGARLRSRMMT